MNCGSDACPANNETSQDGPITNRLLQSINAKSSQWWPKCSAKQFKECSSCSEGGVWPDCNDAPSQGCACGACGDTKIRGSSFSTYTFGLYCDPASGWVEELNNTVHALGYGGNDDASCVARRNFLAHAAHETGYFTSLIQPYYGAAGMISIIPDQWDANVEKMKALFPDEAVDIQAAWNETELAFPYEGAQNATKFNFFLDPRWSWKSAAAFFKGGSLVDDCAGEDLFAASYDRITYCVTGRVSDREEARQIVSQLIECNETYKEPPPSFGVEAINDNLLQSINAQSTTWWPKCAERQQKTCSVCTQGGIWPLCEDAPSQSCACGACHEMLPSKTSITTTETIIISSNSKAEIITTTQFDHNVTAHRFGLYCDPSGGWIEELNAAFFAVGYAANDTTACHARRNFLSQVAYETGYYTSFLRPADSAAGVLNMVPSLWEDNVEKMKTLFPDEAADIQAAWTGTELTFPFPNATEPTKFKFFLDPRWAWKSGAAFFKGGSLVDGCQGEDLFASNYSRITYCISGGTPVNATAEYPRTEALQIVSNVLPCPTMTDI